MKDFLQKLRRKLWPLRRDFTEEEFYSLPLPKQRRILGLGEGQNPPPPSYYQAPDRIATPKGATWPPYPQHRRSDGVICSNQYDTYRWQVEMRRIAAKLLPSAGFGSCHSCGLPWWIVNGHSVDFSATGGCFPVCEMCWRNLNREELWPYYKAQVEQNYPGDEEKLVHLERQFFAGAHSDLLPSNTNK